MKKLTKKKRKIIWLVALILCFVLFAVSAFNLIRYFWKSSRSGDTFDDLASMVTGETESHEPKTILPQYQKVYEENPDTVGWVTIEGTKINYPVMQTDPYDYYIDKDFKHQSSEWGVPFVGYGCNLESEHNHVVIYGHHMIDGSMFSALEYYKNPAFYKDHKYITFNTLYEEQTYEIVYAVKTVVYTANDPFPYWTYTNLSNRTAYQQFITLAEKYQLYDTGIEPEFGDSFLTLSTCEYSQKNGRMLVIARKVTK